MFLSLVYRHFSNQIYLIEFIPKVGDQFSCLNITIFQNSTTLSRLLKVVEDFGVAFTKYLECDNKTENGKTFSFSNISKSLFNVFYVII